MPQTAGDFLNKILLDWMTYLPLLFFLSTMHSCRAFAGISSSRIFRGAQSATGRGPSAITGKSQLRLMVESDEHSGGGSVKAHFDLLVIGAGSGGMATAKRAAQWGAKVALVEKGKLGGTCVNVGCIPKKIMWNAAHVNEMLHASSHYGPYPGFSGALEGNTFDWKAVKGARHAFTAQLNAMHLRNLGSTGVQLIEGAASFAGPREVVVEGDTYTADHVAIAVGGKPAMPDIPGAREHCIDSDGFFALESQPTNVAVVGGGYIAAELAGIFRALGSTTTLFVRGDKVLHSFDALLCDTLHGEMKKQGIHIIPQADTTAVTKETDGTLTLMLKGGETHNGYDCIVMAVGRDANVESLLLERAGVAMTTAGRKKKYVAVDEFQNTNIRGVYALGDVCGKVQLTPMAIAAGRRLADRLFGSARDAALASAKADYDQVPSVVFTHPPIGTIGLSEAAAVAKHGVANVRAHTTTFVNLFYGPWVGEPSSKPKSAMKLVCVGPEERVVGLHTIGMGSDEMIQGFGVAMKMGCTKADLDACVAIHPTASEEFVTMPPWGLKKAPSAWEVKKW